MNEIWIILIVFAAIGVAVWFLFFRGEKGENDRVDVVQPGSYSTEYGTRSLKGVQIYSSRPIDSRVPALADAGLDTLFAAARSYGYLQGLDHSSYIVSLHPRSSRCQNPGFLIDAGSSSPWDQTEWDKDKRPGKALLCVAGMLPPITIVEAQQTSSYLMQVVDDLNIIETVVRFEGEHWILLTNDNERYKATAGVHAHPLLPDLDKGEMAASNKMNCRSYGNRSVLLSN